MKLAPFCNIYAIIILVLSGENSEGLDSKRAVKKTKCLNPPRTARRVESVITECQEEVKTKLINEAFQMMRDEAAQGHPPLNENDDTMVLIDDNGSVSGGMRLMHHIRRVGEISGDVYNPTLVPFEEKRIAGCLLHCVYAKNNAIDKIGWPTLDGLVNFYSEGVNEHGFFMATLRSVNLCLRAVTNKYKVDRRRLPQQGESCDLAFDVFDCISDQITGYCMYHYKQ